MTVRELVEHLAALPQDAAVYLPCFPLEPYTDGPVAQVEHVIVAGYVKDPGDLVVLVNWNGVSE